MKDIEIIKLQRRVSHLERKLVIWASRMKKEVIWRKYMEDWVMNKFNFDLRLQVELKTLEEDGVDEFEKEEIPRQSNPNTNRVNLLKNHRPMAAMSHRQQQPQQPSSSNSMLNRSAARGPATIRPQNINVTSKENRSTLPAVVVTSNTNTQHQPFPPTPTLNIRAPTQLPTPHSVRQAQQSVMMTPQSQNLPLRRQGESSNALVNNSQNVPSTSDRNCNVETTQAQTKRRKIINDPITRPRPLNPVIVSTMTVVNPKSPEVIVLDQEEESNNSNSSGSRNQNHPTSSSSASRIRNNVNLPSNLRETTTVQQLDSFVRNITTEGNPDSLRTENADSSSNEIYADYSESENYYSAGGYLSRRNDAMQSLEFNVRKILLEYDPDSTEASLDEIRTTQNMSVTAKKSITCAASDFLMLVYGENPPRFSKHFMATSLYNLFPFIATETWWCKVPLKNPSGHLEHRINNRRRQLQDERRRQAQQEEGNNVVDSILGLS